MKAYVQVYTGEGKGKTCLLYTSINIFLYHPKFYNVSRETLFCWLAFHSDTRGFGCCFVTALFAFVIRRYNRLFW